MTGDRARRALRTVYLGARALALCGLRLTPGSRARVPEPARVRSLLVVRTDRLGDMVLTTPALADLRRHFRGAEITVLAPPGPVAALEGHPAVDRLAALTRSGLPLEMVGRFDLAVDFTPDHSLRGAMLVGRSGAPYRSGFRGWGRQGFFNLPSPRPSPGRHIVEINRDLVRSLGAQADEGSRPSLYLAPEERGAAQGRLAALGAGSPRVAVHPGGRYPSQRWAPESFAELVTLLTQRAGAACVVLAGPGEGPLVDRICAATPDALAAGPLTVRGMMALIASCELFVGNNSGPLHLAGALGVATVSIMGPTDPARFRPVGPSDRVIRRALPCSPCGRGDCWHHTCLRSIEPDEVLREVEEALRALPAREAAR
ncbi:MAG: glycosyltransferase family 9 protein [Acidobacteriota bacterium]